MDIQKNDRFIRTRWLLGEDAMQRLAGSRVAVFGVGGVGGYVVEALARSGVGALDLCDKDVVDVTNLNRQIVALESTIGRPKVDVAAERVLEINPDCRVTQHPVFFLPETMDQFDFTEYDYVVDAVDTVTAKLALILKAKEAGVPVISSMGAGNKLDPTAFRVADIYDTRVCPLAKVMRRECRKRGIERLKVVYSTEEALVPASRTAHETEKKAAANLEAGKAAAVIMESGKAAAVTMESGKAAAATMEAGKAAALTMESGKNAGKSPRETAGEAGGRPAGREKQSPGSVAFVPSVAGLILAGEVVKDLCR